MAISAKTNSDVRESLEQRLDRLRSMLRDLSPVCIGYSGGVDSVFLAAVAVETLGAGNVLAVTGISAAYPAVQREAALDCARRLGVPHIEIPTGELSDPRYAANPANRCYFCKSELWPRLLEVARQRGFRTVLDGSNADDAHDYRPGFAAAIEHEVRSPLLEAGLSKADVRELSRQRGLPTWDQPASPCLSSRLPYGVPVTVERLRQVEEAEAALRGLGFREFRVRHHDDCLRLEIAPAELQRAEEKAASIHSRLSAGGTSRILLDAEGYRRGALNEVLVQLRAESRPEHDASTAGTTPSAEPLRDPTATSLLPEHEPAGLHGDICVVHGVTVAAARTLAPALRAAGYRYVAVDLAPAAGP